MKLLLDTCTFLWLAADDVRLTAAARAACRSPDLQVIERRQRRDPGIRILWRPPLPVREVFRPFRDRPKTATPTTAFSVEGSTPVRRVCYVLE